MKLYSPKPTRLSMTAAFLAMVERVRLRSAPTATAFRYLGLPLVVALLPGCETLVGSTINVANKVDASRRASEGQELLNAQLRYINELQAKGDPLGEYLWVAANAEGWVANPVTDPEKLKEMYEAAAAKGSSDALVAVGVMLVNGSPTPNMTGKATPLPAERRDWKKGLELIEKGTQTRCWYWEPIIRTITSGNCLRPVIPARIIWPEFRDGWVVPKNAEFANYWRGRNEACKQTLAYQEAHQFCN